MGGGFADLTFAFAFMVVVCEFDCDMTPFMWRGSSVSTSREPLAGLREERQQRSELSVMVLVQAAGQLSVIGRRD